MLLNYNEDNNTFYFRYLFLDLNRFTRESE